MRSTQPNDPKGDDMHHARSTTVIPATVTNAAAAVFAAVGTGVGIYVLGRASQTFTQHLALVVVASAVAVAAIRFAPGTRTPARTWAIAGIAVTLLGAMALGGVLSRETTVDEQVVTASVPAAGADAESSSTTNGTGATSDAAPKQNVLLKHGEFEPLAHDGKGTASLIRTTDGRTVLTLTGFSTDAGPDLDVRLVAGDPSSDSDVESGRSVRLGALKGTSGDQQYVLPADVDPSEFTHAYVWCRAFSVGFTRARLA